MRCWIPSVYAIWQCWFPLSLIITTSNLFSIFTPSCYKTKTKDLPLGSCSCTSAQKLAGIISAGNHKAETPKKKIRWMNEQKSNAAEVFFLWCNSSRHPAVRVDAWWQHNHTPAKMAVPAVWSRDAGVLCGVWIGCAVHQCGVRWKKIVKKERRKKGSLEGGKRNILYSVHCWHSE